MLNPPVLSQSRHPERLQALAWQSAGLLHPGGELGFVELIVLVDIEIARLLLFGLAGRHGPQRRAAEKSHLDVFRKDMDAEKPALFPDAVKRRIPFDRLAHAGDSARDERIEAASDLAFPARHGRDVGLHGRVAVAR